MNQSAQATGVLTTRTPRARRITRVVAKMPIHAIIVRSNYDITKPGHDIVTVMVEAEEGAAPERVNFWCPSSLALDLPGAGYRSMKFTLEHTPDGMVFTAVEFSVHKLEAVDQ